MRTCSVCFPKLASYNAFMSEKIVKLLLDDLKFVRIVCRKCGSAVELPIDKLQNATAAYCPGCPPPNKTLLRSSAADPLAGLASILIDLKQNKDIDIEFVVTETE